MSLADDIEEAMAYVELLENEMLVCSVDKGPLRIIMDGETYIEPEDENETYLVWRTP